MLELRTGDCLDERAGLPSLGDMSVDSTITDPPYEVEAHTMQRRVKRGGGMSSEPLQFSEMSADVRGRVAAEIARITRRWALVFCQIEAAVLWRDALVAGGLVYKRTCIWVKPDGMPQYSGDRPGMGYEAFVVCHAKGRSRWNGGGRKGVFTHPKNDPVRTGHQTQKPLSLIRELVELFTDPGDLVCDPFAGSGTTGVSCRELGRNFIGWEIDEKFADIGRRRIAGSAYAEPANQTLMFADVGEG